jgi:hypothetical protein
MPRPVQRQELIEAVLRMRAAFGTSDTVEALES